MNITPLQEDTQSHLFELYPDIKNMDFQSRFKLTNNSLLTSLPPQTPMQTQPGPYQHLFLLLEGNTRAFQTDNNGRELSFYRNYPGDICPANLHQLYHYKPVDYLVKAETTLHGIQISKKNLQECMQSSNSFHEFIIRQLSRSFGNLGNKMSAHVFQKLDQRLCNLLNDLFTQQGVSYLDITHQKLANELGTTREVISRSLKALEQQGRLKINRGKLTKTSSAIAP